MFCYQVDPFIYQIKSLKNVIRRSKSTVQLENYDRSRILLLLYPPFTTPVMTSTILGKRCKEPPISELDQIDRKMFLIQNYFTYGFSRQSCIRIKQTDKGTGESERCTHRETERQRERERERESHQERLQVKINETINKLNI